MRDLEKPGAGGAMERPVISDPARHSLQARPPRCLWPFPLLRRSAVLGLTEAWDPVCKRKTRSRISLTGAPFGQQSDLSLIRAFANPRAPRMNDRCFQDRHKRASGLAAEPTLSRAIQDRLGRELRDMYAEIQRDTVTGRLADLVRQLELKDSTLRGRA